MQNELATKQIFEEEIAKAAGHKTVIDITHTHSHTHTHITSTRTLLTATEKLFESIPRAHSGGLKLCTIIRENDVDKHLRLRVLKSLIACQYSRETRFDKHSTWPTDCKL